MFIKKFRQKFRQEMTVEAVLHLENPGHPPSQGLDPIEDDMKTIRLKALGLLAILSLGAPPSIATASWTVQEMNVLPAILSYDYAVADLGNAYGIDPSMPTQSVSGMISGTGFSWLATGIYFGQSFSFSESGVYDPTTSSLQWSGTGTYGSATLTFSGNVVYTTDSTYSINHYNTLTNSQGMGIDESDGNDTVNATISGDPDLGFKVLNSTHKFLGIPWKSGPDPADGYNLVVNGQTIVSNTYMIASKTTGVGVTVQGTGGSINFGNNTFVKTTQLGAASTPEPSSLVLLGIGIGGFLTFRIAKSRRSG